MKTNTQQSTTGKLAVGYALFAALVTALYLIVDALRTVGV